MNGNDIKFEQEKVAILVVTYGNYSGLRHTVESILIQDYPIHEIVLSDDGSGDIFPGDVMELLQTAPCKVTIRQGEKNLGTTAHFNHIAKMVHSTYLKFIAAGDAFASSASLRELVTYARGQHTLVVCSNTAFCDKSLKKKYYEFPGKRRGKKLSYTGTRLFNLLAQTNIISAVGVLFHKDFFTQLGGFNETYRLLEDWPTWLRLVRMGYCIPFLNHVTCLHSAGGISTKEGSAYKSTGLRDDMKYCYEKEIFPYSAYFTRSEWRKIQYRYAILENQPKQYMLANYPDLLLKDLIREHIKISLKTGKDMGLL